MKKITVVQNEISNRALVHVLECVTNIQKLATMDFGPETVPKKLLEFFDKNDRRLEVLREAYKQTHRVEVHAWQTRIQNIVSIDLRCFKRSCEDFHYALSAHVPTNGDEPHVFAHCE